MVTGSAWILSSLAGQSRAMENQPSPQGIRKMEGDVRVNGQPARMGLLIKPSDVVTTGPKSMVVFVAGDDVFLLRSESRLEVSGTGKSEDSSILDFIKISSGKMLSVFGYGPKKIETQTALIGVRGTGLYLEAGPTKTYICACYGVLDLAPAGTPDNMLQVSTKHHEAGKHIHAPGAEQLITSAPMQNHTDAELIYLESLVGRKPPFVQSKVKNKGNRGY